MFALFSNKNFKVFKQSELLFGLSEKKDISNTVYFTDFGQAKFAYGALILSLSHFFLLPQQPLKNNACCKIGQN
jgi:hypothetical protein